MNILVDTLVMKEPMDEIVPRVLHNKTGNQLSHCDVPGETEGQVLIQKDYMMKSTILLNKMSRKLGNYAMD